MDNKNQICHPNNTFFFNSYSLNIFVSNHEEHALMRKFDQNNDGVISMEEFYNTLASSFWNVMWILEPSIMWILDNSFELWSRAKSQSNSLKVKFKIKRALLSYVYHTALPQIL